MFLGPDCLRDWNQRPPWPTLPRRPAALHIGAQWGLWEMCVSETQFIQALFHQKERWRGVSVLMCCCVDFCVSCVALLSKQAPNGTKPQGIELLLTATTLHVCQPCLPLSLPPCLLPHSPLQMVSCFLSFLSSAHVFTIFPSTCRHIPWFHQCCCDF